MIRYTLLAIIITFLLAYAWRDWFRSLCGLLLFMAVLERPDMPRQLLGIPGLNPWNLLMLSVFAAWLVNRRKEGLTADAPALPFVLVAIFALTMVIATLRMLGDMRGMVDFATIAGLERPSRSGEIIELFNNLKFLLPAAMIFDGCRTRERWRWAVAAILVTGLLMAFQIIRLMPIGLLVDGDQLQHRALRVLDREIGYHRVDLAAIMASVSWAFVAVITALERRSLKWLCLAAAFVSFVAVLLTGGRTGFVAWGAVGAAFAVLRWRSLLIIGPALTLIGLALVPAARERLLEGFSPESYEHAAQSVGIDTIDDSGHDLYAVTSGRIVVWPIVLDRIADSPWIGYGRRAMQRIGVSMEVLERTRTAFSHPHNAYLEWVLDNGILGAIPVFWFFGMVLHAALTLLRARSSRTAVATGGICLAFVLGQLVASLGSQSFYPRQGVVLMWCTIALALRLQAEVKRVAAARAAAVPAAPLPTASSV